MPQCLDASSWRKATPEEVVAFTKKFGESRRAHIEGRGARRLVVRKHLKQADVYAYLRARFGVPNGFQNFLRSNSSDNLVHWDFVLKAGSEDVYLQGVTRDVQIIVSEGLSDEQWKQLICSIKADFARVRHEKSEMMDSFEKFLVFQNKFAVLADLCAELHASITEAPPKINRPPKLTSDKSIKRYKRVMDGVSKRAADLYGNCLKLKLLTPIMAEAYINMLILVFCKKEVRNDVKGYGEFIRANIPERLAQLSTLCFGFESGIDQKTEMYGNFLRVMNERNFAVHGNVDPLKEQIETVYFEGKRPLFTEAGDNVFRLFEHLEAINNPTKVIQDYENVLTFLLEIKQCLSGRFRDFFDIVIDDPYPGYELRAQRVTKILPSHNAAMLFPNEFYDHDLKVRW